MLLLAISITCIATGYFLLLTASPDDYHKAVGMALTGILLSVSGGGMLVIGLFRRITGR